MTAPKEGCVDLVESSQLGSRRHPWELARCDFFVWLLRRHRLLVPGVVAYDIGAGDGWLADQLRARFPGALIRCIDSGYGDGAPPAAGPDALSSLPPTPADVVLLLDVLEHVDDDVEFLREIRLRSLRPGGAVLVSVPAWPSLWSGHDEALGHRRRYTTASVLALLRAAGLHVVEHGGLFATLLPARAALAALERVGVRRASLHSRWEAGALTTALVRGVLRLDARMGEAAARLRLPWTGLSRWAVCRSLS
ncbi:MAG: class I SAM-dependent methyltransferase [Myxococcota bacterium]|nr:class I SAM-dependent methyltransferase [Myxococcota bacterium]MDW8362607.1 methyltransferase domain-containing protein [Myxococcales bacterium]